MCVLIRIILGVQTPPEAVEAVEGVEYAESDLDSAEPRKNGVLILPAGIATSDRAPEGLDVSKVFLEGFLCLPFREKNPWA